MNEQPPLPIDPGTLFDTAHEHIVQAEAIIRDLTNNPEVPQGNAEELANTLLFLGTALDWSNRVNFDQSNPQTPAH